MVVLNDEQEKTNQARVVTPVELQDCSPESLKLGLLPEPGVINEGESVVVNLQVTNMGEDVCVLTTDRLSVDLKMNGESVWTPTACSDSWQKTLLLDKGLLWNTSLTWNGAVYSECEARTVQLWEGEAAGNTVPATASAGAYQLSAEIIESTNKEITNIVVQ